MSTASSAADTRLGRRFAVFLDRDGVINRPAPEGEYIRRRDEFNLLPGVPSALGVLRGAGAELFVVTNQRGVARGLVDPEELSAIHVELAASLADEGVSLAGIYVCPHEEGTCDCRKPGIGLFMQAREAHPWIDFGSSELVGDSISDVGAGHALGTRNWVVGAKREGVVADAARLGINLAGAADSLPDLVADAGFRAALGLT